MKTTPLMLIVSVTLLAGLTAMGGEGKDAKKTKSSEQKAKAAETSGSATNSAVVTGSYIKQKVNRSGRITDGPSQVIVLDRDTIERSGASDVKQLLVHQGIR